MLKQSVAYLGSSLINKSVPFLLLPVLTRYMTPAEFGIIVLFQLTLTFYQAALGLCLNVHVARAKYSLSLENFRDYLSAMFFVLSVMLVLGVFLSFIAYLVFGDFLGFGARWLFMLPVIACMSMSNMIYMTLLRAENQVLKYASWEFLATILNMGLSLLLVVGLRQGWEGRALGIAVPLFVVGISVVPILWRQRLIGPGLVRSDVLEIVQISGPLIPHAIAAVIISMSDRYFIGQLMGASAVGVYSVAIQFGMVLMLVSDAFAKAWQPFFFQHMAKDTEADRLKIVRYTIAYVSGMGLFSLLYGAAVYALFPWLVGKDFQSARELVFPAVLIYLPYTAYQMAFLYLVLLKKTGVLAFTTVASAILAIALNYLLIGAVGMVGGAISLFLAYLLNFMLVFAISQKHLKMPWPGVR